MPSKISLNTRLQIPNHILFRELEGEAVVLNLQNGIYFGLDRTGTYIWNLLQKRKTLGNILHALMEEYEVDQDRCRKDVLALAGELNKNGLVEIAAA